MTYIKKSKIHLKTKLKNNKSYIEHIEFTPPFKIARPFYNEEGAMTIMLLNVSAGIMEGDDQRIEIQVLEGSEVTVVGQSYEKIHKMKEGNAKRRTKLIVEKNGFLNYSPLPCIPFEGSSFETDTEVFLEDSSSKLIYSEILTCGRVGRGELFKYKEYTTRTKIYRGGKIIYFDSGRLIPQTTDMHNLCMFQNFTHLANIVVVNLECGEEKIEKIREIIENEKNMEGGVSRFAYKGIIFRLLGKSSEQIIKLQESIFELLTKL